MSDRLIGTEIGGCRLERAIGKGGMGAVYLATHLGLRSQVAVKILRLDRARTEERVERFLGEARVLARLNHPNIVRIHDAGTLDDTFYLILEYVAGQSLALRLQDLGQAVPWIEAVYIGREVAVGLDQVHANGIVHRDLKAGNVFLGPATGGLPATVKLGDFGLALAEEANRRLTGVGRVVGSMRYLSPEQVAGEPASVATDIYALGVTLYRVLSTHWPHPGEEANRILRHIARKAPVPLAEAAPELPPAVHRVIDDLVASDPIRRGRLASDVAMRLDEILRHVASIEAPPMELAAPALLDSEEDARAKREERGTVPVAAAGPHFRHTDPAIRVERPPARRRPEGPPARGTGRAGRRPSPRTRRPRPAGGPMSPWLILAGGAGILMLLALLFIGLWAATGDDDPDETPVVETQPVRRPPPEGPPARPEERPPTPVSGDPESVWAYVETYRVEHADLAPAELEEQVHRLLVHFLIGPTLDRTRDLSHEARIDPARGPEKLADALEMLARVENPGRNRLLPDDLRDAVRREVERIEAQRAGGE